MSVSSASSSPAQGLLHAPIAWLFSSLGKKTVVAVTGIALGAVRDRPFAGQSHLFLRSGGDQFYAMHLRDLGPLLWVARIGLLGAVVLHIYFTMLVWKENQAARPQKYAVKAPMKTTVFARTMRLTGLIVLAFVVFHLAHFTLWWVDPNYSTYHAVVDGHEVHDVYRMVITGFSNPDREHLLHLFRWRC